ncbi:MAG TPA: asparaginase [Gaiellaceae bacterium]|jgi:L-asparaginase II
MEPIRVVVRRGGVVEATHRVHAAATSGEHHGDPSLVAFLRSSLKPIQAVPLVEGWDDLADDEIAIACASHQAEPAQLDAVRKLLARAGAGPDELENGEQEGRPDGRLGHNCSGKHAGMLAACRAHGWPAHPYRDPDHPLQRRVAELVGAVDGLGVDGCGVPTFAMPLARMAEVFARVPPRIAAAMRARPELVGGRGADDTDLMRALPGWTAKRGAEGLLCALSPDGVGWALKVEDGASRALRPALGALLGIDAFREVPVENSLGETVGSIGSEPA